MPMEGRCRRGCKWRGRGGEGRERGGRGEGGLEREEEVRGEMGVCVCIEGGVNEGGWWNGEEG